MNFADNLKRICTERGTSPTALLKSMGVATSKVAMWNSGSLPKQEMLIRLAKELDCSTIRCKSEPLLLCEERLRVCGRNRGHGMSRDLYVIILRDSVPSKYRRAPFILQQVVGLIAIS